MIKLFKNDEGNYVLAVIKEDDSFAGCPCLCYEEAKGDDEPAGIDDDCGFNPYMGCYDYDC